jgi:hypothetical protein
MYKAVNPKGAKKGASFPNKPGGKKYTGKNVKAFAKGKSKAGY